jgi:hypothetical protein
MTKRSAIDPPLELWAGVECTINRVDDTFFDQLEWSDHTQRLDDLERFAALGIRALRHPIQWERTAPGGLAQADWSWADSRLGRLRELGIRPIVGLVHYGSGPSTTNLLDPAFPDRLAQFAGAVAERYPWIADYTPVNEPLTTARFSGLYGHWYPHGRDELARDLAADRTPDHPVLAAPGWWRRPHRFFFGDDLDPGAAEPSADASRNCKSAITHEPRPILIVGAGGTLGRAFMRLCELRGLPYQARTRQELDIADPAQVGAELERVRPWAVVNAAGYVHVDQAECEPEQCFRANAGGAAMLQRTRQRARNPAASAGGRARPLPARARGRGARASGRFLVAK